MTENQKLDKTTIIVAVNMGLLIVYTLFLRLVSTNGTNLYSLTCFVGIHFSLCLIAAAFGYRKGFLLSAAILFLIGFSTCTYTFFGH